MAEHGFHKRKTLPHKSLPFIGSTDQKMQLGIVQLDVYSVFKTAPKKLLYPRRIEYSPESTKWSPPSPRSSRATGTAGSNGSNGQPNLQFHSPPSHAKQFQPSPIPNKKTDASVLRIPRKRGRPPSSATRLNLSFREKIQPPPFGTVFTPITNIIVDGTGKPMISGPKSELTLCFVRKLIVFIYR